MKSHVRKTLCFLTPPPLRKSCWNLSTGGAGTPSGHREEPFQAGLLVDQCKLVRFSVTETSWGGETHPGEEAQALR